MPPNCLFKNISMWDASLHFDKVFNKPSYKIYLPQKKKNHYFFVFPWPFRYWWWLVQSEFCLTSFAYWNIQHSCTTFLHLHSSLTNYNSLLVVPMSSPLQNVHLNLQCVFPPSCSPSMNLMG